MSNAKAEGTLSKYNNDYPVLCFITIHLLCFSAFCQILEWFFEKTGCSFNIVQIDSFIYGKTASNRVLSIKAFNAGVFLNRSILARTWQDLNQTKGQGKFRYNLYICSVPFRCTSLIRLPAEDPDGDKVRCRWAKPAECGHACTNTPVNTVWIDEVVTKTINVYSFFSF